MKICLAQTTPAKGDIAKNIRQHKRLIYQGIDQGANFIIFPELSLTGYEPELASELTFEVNDEKLDIFQKISDQHDIVLAIGAPTRHAKGICISLILFQPQQDRKLYSKKYLHIDEEPFFVSGENFPVLDIQGKRLALAICYELSVEAHTKEAFLNQPDVYIASVAKSFQGMQQAAQRLSHLAQSHQTPTFIVNCVGPSSGFESVGMSSVWDSKGALFKQLSNHEADILLYDLSHK